MYVRPTQKKTYVVYYTIAVIAMAFVVGAVYWGVNFFSYASKSTNPIGLTVSNVSSDSVYISWVTADKVVGTVKLKDGRIFTDVDGLVEKNTHYVELNGLDPDTTYEFTILSGADQTTTDSLGNNLVFKTLPELEDSFIRSVSGKTYPDSLVLIFLDKYVFTGLSAPSGDFSLEIRLFDSYSTLDSTIVDLFVINQQGDIWYVSDVFASLFDDSGDFIASDRLTKSNLSTLESVAINLPSLLSVSGPGVDAVSNVKGEISSLDTVEYMDEEPNKTTSGSLRTNETVKPITISPLPSTTSETYADSDGEWKSFSVFTSSSSASSYNATSSGTFDNLSTEKDKFVSFSDL